MKTSFNILKYSSFIIYLGIIALLVYLTYNTFLLQDNQLYTTERALLNESYSQSIRNDKLFPGGQEILDSHIMNNIYTLDSLHQHSKEGYRQFVDSTFLALYQELQDRQTMDSLFNTIKEKYNLNPNLEYLLTIYTIKINSSDDEPFRFMPSKTILTDYKSKYGLIISGNLKKPLPQNTITSITVSSPLVQHYEITFTLFVDVNERQAEIVKQIWPTLLLAIGSALTLLVLLYFLFRSWHKQNKLLEVKSDFINTITHEFNTPLSTLRVSNTNLKKAVEKRDLESIASKSEVIERQARRLQDLFNKALYVSSLKERDLVVEKVDLISFINGIKEDFIINYQQVTLELIIGDEFSKDTFYIFINRFTIITTINNILENGIKYNSKLDKKITITLTTDLNQNIVLKMKDNGDGINSTDLKNIFKKFHRSKEINSSINGLGLGLYYVYTSIKLHSWKIKVQTLISTGTEFTILIPKSNYERS